MRIKDYRECGLLGYISQADQRTDSVATLKGTWLQGSGASADPQPTVQGLTRLSAGTPSKLEIQDRSVTADQQLPSVEDTSVAPVSNLAKSCSFPWPQSQRSQELKGTPCPTAEVASKDLLRTEQCSRCGRHSQGRLAWNKPHEMDMK
ncbi:hypothetical protein P7K49_013364, partial [Saguinus oedipus]